MGSFDLRDRAAAERSRVPGAVSPRKGCASGRHAAAPAGTRAPAGTTPRAGCILCAMLRLGPRLAVGALLIALLAALLLRGGGRDTSLRRGLERLKSLPYLAWTAADAGPGGGGAAPQATERAWPGVNLYASESASGAWAVDLAGRRVFELEDRRPEPTIWKLVEPLPGGGFGVLAAGGTILAVDGRSRRLWSVTSTFHHDFDVTSDGRLVAPAFHTRRVAALAPVRPVRDDVLEVYDRDRRLVDRVSAAELVQQEPELLARARAVDHRLLDWRLDVFHTNTVEVLDREVAWPGGPRWPAGAVLVCWRNLDTVAVVDLEGRRILWHWGAGELERPHHPTLLADGRLLVFDNGTRRGWSRVVEVDPGRREIVWEYRADPPEAFFTSSRGAAQRLPNGNTLIVESDAGRAFEVTRQGETVWEYLDPRVRRDWLGRTERATIYRMLRLDRTELERIAGAGG